MYQNLYLISFLLCAILYLEREVTEMFGKKNLTVRQYVERRTPDRYNKRIRVIGSDSYKWWDNMDKVVKSVKVTASYVIIFV